MSLKFDIDVKIPEGFARLAGRLSVAEVRDRLEDIGRGVAVSLAKYFNRISRTRHKTARRLGAEPTHILEFYEGYPPFSMGGAEITAYRAGSKSVFVEVSGIPFLGRAYGDVTIVPKMAHALTIPIHRYSYAKSAADMKRDGWSLFTLGSRGRYGTKRNRGILFGMKGMEGPVPLFRFSRHVTLPQDAKLMPSSEMVGRWAADALERSLVA